ncbi:MAG: SpoIIE family protein phosphatase, partial [Eubacteriales bacterium]|nr:SpoIIE family protein phosphatase [Eubacteriales bacterium]
EAAEAAGTAETAEAVDGVVWTPADEEESEGIGEGGLFTDRNSYSAVLYNNTNGLPTSEANDIAQTGEGFIWIGSYGGLIRYDGCTFERMDSTSGVGSVVSLFVDSVNRLWIGTNDNGVALMENGEFRQWDEDDGLSSDKVSSIKEDREGNIYVATTAGITMFSTDLTLSDVSDPRVSGAYIERLRLGNDGLLYCLTNEGDIFTLRDGQVVDYIGHEHNCIQGITSVLPDPEAPGKNYFGTESSALYYGNLQDRSDTLVCYDISPLYNVINMKKYGDEIWICARNGIGMIDSEGFHHTGDLPMQNSVSHVMKDYEGNLWFTSSRQGVMKVVPNRFSDLFERNGLPQQVVNCTCMHEGELFVGTDTGLVVIGEEGEVSSVPIREASTASGEKLNEEDLLELLRGCRIRSIIRDSSGRLWFSTWRSRGLVRYDQGKVTVFTEEDGLVSAHLRAVAETSDGSILAAGTGGVSVIRGDRVTGSYGSGDGIENQETLTVCAAPNGDILLGSNGGGIYIINGEGTRCVSKADGLISQIIMRIKYDPAREVFWIVTSNSIAYMTADYHVTTVRNFPFSNNFDLYENSKGDMWILSSNGIYVVPADELIANGKIEPVHYSLANGMSCTATSNSYSALTEEGDLYIAGNMGVVKVNIEKSLEVIHDLKQAVPYIDIDGRRVFPDERGGFTIPSGVRKLTIYGYVFNYSLTDPQVSYCLEGFDREPVTVSRRDFDPVDYTNLPGGSYRFVMELKDAMGRGSEELDIPIIKEKALYEHTWFYLLSGLFTAMLAAFLVQMYDRRKMIALEKKHREEAERERISRELQMANRIQSATLPHEFPPFPERPEFGLYASMDPAREVGGDFYDFFLIDDDHLCLVIADVSGKGIPAALFMMVSKSILKSFAAAGQDASEILRKANEAICSNNQTDMFVSVWIGILEISSGRLIAANAGHEYPAVRRAGEKFELLKDRHGLVIGAMEMAKYREYELQLSPGDRIFVYTDGVPEAANAENQMFGTDRMIDALNTEPDAGPEELLKNVRAAVDGFVRGAEQFDDLTMLALEYKGSRTG